MRFYLHTTDGQIAGGLAILAGCSLLDLFIPNLFSSGIFPSFFFAAVGAAIALPIDLAYLAIFAPIFLISIPLSISRWIYALSVLGAFAVGFFFIRKHLTRGSYLAAFVGGLSVSFLSALLFLLVGSFGGGTSLTATGIFVSLINGILTGILACVVRALVHSVVRI